MTSALPTDDALNERRRAAAEGLFSLPPSAELLWEFMSALNPQDPASCREGTMQSLRLSGGIDLEALDGAVSDMSRRHEALRVVFDDIGLDPVLRVVPEMEPPLDVLDLTRCSPAVQRDKLAELAHRETYRAFDLLRGPLWHVCVARLSAREHLLTTSFSHIIADGWSNRVFTADLLDAYRARMGQGPRPAPLNLSFQDIIDLQSAALAARPERLAYWQGHLARLPRYLPFQPEAAPRDADLILEERHRFTIPPPLADALRAVAWKARTTPFAVLMAAYHILIARHTNSERVIISTTTLGRDSAISKRIVGQFTNDVCVGVPILPDAPLVSVIKLVHQGLTAATENALSYQCLAAAVNPDFAGRRPWPDNHLFDSYFQAATPAAPAQAWPELRAEQVFLDDQRRPETFQSLTAADVPDQCLPVWIKRGSPIIIADDDRQGGVMVYNPSFFDAQLIALLVADYLSILGAMATDPATVVAALPGARSECG